MARKIVCIIDSLNSGGAQHQMINLCLGLVQEGYLLNLLVLNNIDKISENYDLNNLKISFCKRKSILFKFIFCISNFYKADSNIIIAFQSGPNIIANFISQIFIFKKIKIIVSERTGSIRLNFFDIVRINSYLFSNYIVVNSDQNRIQIKHGLYYGKARVVRIYNGLRENYERSALKFGNKKNIVILANYRPEKNLLKLLKLIFYYPNSYHFSFNWYGEIFEGVKNYNGENLYELGLEFIKSNQLEDIIYLNSRTNDVNKTLLESHALLLGSEYEGFPNVICEAMAVGIPVISTKVSDIENLIIEGENGFLFDIYDQISFNKALDAILHLSEYEYNDIAINNIKLAEELFSKKKMINNFIKLF